MNIKILKHSILTFLILIFTQGIVTAQIRMALQPGSTVTVSGTSNAQDWEMTSTNPTSSAEFKMLTNGKPDVLQSLNFTLQKRTLRSDKSGLERKAFEALRADRNPVISFQSTAPVNVKQNGETLLITTEGNLRIAGVTRVIDVAATCTNGQGNTLICRGETKLRMTDFNVEPPTMMLGALRVANDITISYSVIYK